MRMQKAAAMALLLGGASAVLAREPGGSTGDAPVDIVEVRASAAAGKGAGAFALSVDLEIAAGWHVNAHVLEDEFLIPTVVELGPVDGVTVGELAYPEPELMSFAFSPDEKLRVYDGTVTVTGELKVAKAPAAPIPGKVRYQACNDMQCLPPKTVAFTVALGAAPAVAPSPATPAPSATPPAPRPGGPSGGASPGAPGAGVDLAGRGLLSTLAIVFLGGLLLNLTPCVYPVIPITVAYFGNQSAGKLGRSFGLASVYVLGMALTYSVLGVMAALGGAMLGQALQSRWVLGGIVGLMVALALSSFGLFEIRLPSALTSRAGARQGVAGAFLMGLLMGVVAAPCIGPFVVALLTYVGTRGDPVLGFGLFFVLALGLGTPFLFLAAFSGRIRALPRSGAWMLGVKRIFGIVLLGVAIYFAGPLMPDAAFAMLWRLFAVGAAVYLLGFEPLGNAPGRLGASFKAAFAASVFVVFWAAGGFGGGRAEGIAFQPFTAEALQVARAAGRPALVDFTADWCIPCRELEHRTFVDPAVRQLAGSFASLRADITEGTPEDVQELMKRHGVAGPPTVLILGPDGTEWRDLRVEGFLDARAFAHRLSQALDRAGNVARAGAPPSPR